MMSTESASSPSAACSLRTDVERYHTGTGSDPIFGDTVTIDYPPTSAFDGFDLWYKVSTGVIQVASDGTVIDFQICP